MCVCVCVDERARATRVIYDDGRSFAITECRLARATRNAVFASSSPFNSSPANTPSTAAVAARSEAAAPGATGAPEPPPDGGAAFFGGAANMSSEEPFSKSLLVFLFAAADLAEVARVDRRRRPVVCEQTQRRLPNLEGFPHPRRRRRRRSPTAPRG